MSTLCGKTNCAKSSTRYKKCAACDKQFHSTCGEFSSYKDKSKPDETIRLCSACSAVPANSASLTLRYHSRSNSASSHSSKRKAIESADSASSDEEEPDLKTILQAIKKGNRSTDTLVKGLQTSVEVFNANLTARCDVLDKKFAELKTEFTQHKEAHSRELEALKEKNDELEFKTKTEVYIHGHANSGAPDLDLNVAVIHLAEFLDLTVTDRDLQRVRIIKRREKSYSSVTALQPIIAADFYSHEMALRLVDAKKRHGKLLNSDLLQTTNTSPISISFPLDREKYALLREAKIRAQMHNVRYVWNSRGSIFVRETDGARAIKVRSLAHLDELMPPEATPQHTAMDTTEPQQH